MQEIAPSYENLFLQHQIDIAPNEKDGVERLRKQICDIILFNFPENGSDNITSLQNLRINAPDIPIVVTSKKEKADLIVEAIRSGASDFLVRPFPPKKLEITLNRELENRILRYEIDYLRRQQDVIYDFSNIIAVSPAMKEVMSSIKKLADTDSAFLITGETGTGKSFLSGAIHFNSRRRKKPFVKVNCASIPDTLLESEFFGHEKGAFTGADKSRIGRFEQADGGTVFLDEIGEMSHSLQAKLLGVVDDCTFERVGGNKSVTVHSRIISATNVDIEKEMERGNFRRDLYYRINVLRVHLPPLRERRKCIIPLANQLLEKLKRSTKKKKVVGFSSEVIEMFDRYHWPGNIRELSNTIERAILLEESEIIQKANVLLNEQGQSKPEMVRQMSLRLEPEQEKAMILETLEKCMWIQKDAAKQLNMSPRSLNYRIKKLGIKYKHWRKNR